MLARPAAAADLDLRNASTRQLMLRMAAAVIAAEARARQRREYMRLMESDDIMQDVGVTRDDLRRALRVLDGRA